MNFIRRNFKLKLNFVLLYKRPLFDIFLWRIRQLNVM